MKFDSYAGSDVKMALSLPLECPPPLQPQGFKLKAFTLAETLITLTIIGIIGAMTIPTLMNKYQKHTYVVGLKKAYSVLSNAVKMLPIIEPDCADGAYKCLWDSEDPHPGNATVNGLSISIISKAFKNAEIATTEEKCGKMLLGASSVKGCMITPDGMIFSSYSNIRIGTQVNVDINGLKGPNQPGRDIFTFYITNDNDRIAAAGSKLYSEYINDSFYWNHNPASPRCNQADLNGMKNFSYDSYCTARVLEEDAMNY